MSIGATPPPTSPPPLGDPATGPGRGADRSRADQRRGPLREGLVIGLAALLGAAVVLGGLVAWRLAGDADQVAATGQAGSGDEGREGDEDGDAGGAGSADDPGRTDPDTGLGTDPGPAEDGDDGRSGADDGNDGAERSDGTATGPEADGAGPGRPDPSVETIACPGGTDPVICDAAEFVQQVRGRPFKEFPVVELLEDAEFDRALIDDFDDYSGELRQDGRVLKALGLIEPDEDYVALYRSLLEVGPVGFYDSQTERLVVRGDELDLYGQLILVHELVHAFDDQWFGLDADYGSLDEEYAHSAVIEGNASRVENIWRAGLSPADRSTLALEEQASISEEDARRLLTLPEAMLALVLSPYRDGEVFVVDRVVDGGEAAVDQALTVSPPSSEVILHPELSGPAARVVELEQPVGAGPTTGDGRLGELLVDLWLGETAAEGWGGDHYSTYDAADQTCLVVDLAADTAADLDEIEDAAARWASETSARRVERIDGVDRSTVRVTSCFTEG